MAASDSLSLEPGIDTVSKWAVLAFRMRVSMSAIGSVIVIVRRPLSPTGLRHAGDLLVVDHLGEDQLLGHSKRVVAMDVERPGRQPTEVPDAGNGHRHQTVEELPGP